MSAVSFRIRKRYFDLIVSGEKKEELRSLTPFWKRRLLREEKRPKVAVFICGEKVHRRHITDIYVDRPERILGRPLSPQGEKDITTELCIAVKLGEPA